MTKIKILVIEDEIIIADHLCDILNELGYECFEPAINYSEAIDSLKTSQPDIAIIDIQLGGKKTGIDLAEYINENYSFPFIFLTSNSDPLTIEKAKKVNPYTFLTKPFTRESIYSTIEIVLNMSKSMKPISESDKNYFFLKDKGALVKLYFDEICYLKSDHVYTEIFLKNETVKVFRIGLNTIMEKLPEKFIRVHRSYIINYDCIAKINTNSITINTETIPVGAKYKQSLFEKIGDF